MPMRLLTILLLFIATSVGAAPNGTKLFKEHCAACHGEHGEGGVGVPLALADFQANVDDNFLFQTIRNGRPGRVMPAFKTLSDAQVDALVAHIRSWKPEGVEPLAGIRVGQGDAGRGKALFASHCAACHGEHGQGGHGTGVTMSRPRDYPIIPPALNNPGFLKAASDRVIKATLVNGREGTPMISFLKSGVMSEQDIDDVVSYIRSFENEPLHWQHAETDEPILEYESSYSLEETVKNVERAAVGKNFRIIRIQHLDNGLVPEDEENANEVVIYFCNFSFINRALSLDPRVGMFMPCRITAVERDGVVKLMSINPSYMSRLYNNSEIDAACREMQDVYTSIMDEATL